MIRRCVLRKFTAEINYSWIFMAPWWDVSAFKFGLSGYFYVCHVAEIAEVVFEKNAFFTMKK